MIQLFCTCNQTLPLDQATLKNINEEKEHELFVVHDLCARSEEFFNSLDIGPDGIFIGCNRQHHQFVANLARFGIDDNLVMTRDLAKLLTGFSGNTAARLALAYSAEARVRLARQQITTPWFIEVGPRLVVAGPYLSRPTEHALSTHLELIRINTSPSDHDNFLCGRIIGVQGSIGNFTITVATDSPVDPTRCIHCNACIKACQHQAIRTDYTIDIDSCDSCGKCEEACRLIGAFSLSSKERTITTDQLIWAEGLLPEKPGLYQPKNEQQAISNGMEALTIAVTGRVEAFPSITFNDKLCGHYYADNIGCSLCLDICPRQALISDKGHIEINHKQCYGCQACTAVCPSGSISSLPLNSDDIGAALYEFCNQLDPGITVALTCEACNNIPTIPTGHAIFTYPKLHIIEPDHILAALSQNISSLALFPCSRCHPQTDVKYKLTIDILKHFNADHLLCWQDRAIQTAPDLHKELPPTNIPEWQHKRANLSSVLEPLVALSSEESTTLNGPFGHIMVQEELCTGCGACFAACPNDALTGDDKQMMIIAKDISCINCRLCTTVCPEKALTIVPGLRWNSSVFKSKTVAQVEGLACRKCNKVFATKKVVEVVLARLQGQLDHDTRQRLTLCPDCRVIASLVEE